MSLGKGRAVSQAHHHITCMLNLKFLIVWDFSFFLLLSAHLPATAQLVGSHSVDLCCCIIQLAYTSPASLARSLMYASSLHRRYKLATIPLLPTDAFSFAWRSETWRTGL
ncbi:uncharacterized protein EV420DRAFT_1545624, partial [Desarmillaria tabescens]